MDGSDAVVAVSDSGHDGDAGSACPCIDKEIDMTTGHGGKGRQ